MRNWFRRDKKNKNEAESAGNEPAAAESDVSEDSGAAAHEAGPSPVEADRAAGEKDQATEDPSPKKKGFLARLKERLADTRAVLNTRVDHLLLGVKEVDDDVLEELEEILITSDLGINTAQVLIKAVSDAVARRELSSADKLKETLRREMVRIMSLPAPERARDRKPHVMMVVGINGVGKTTTIAKLAHRFKTENKEVMLVAGDHVSSGRGRAACHLERTGGGGYRQAENRGGSLGRGL